MFKKEELPWEPVQKNFKSSQETTNNSTAAQIHTAQLQALHKRHIKLEHSDQGLL